MAREVLARSIAGVRGAELHRTLGQAPLGWPQDAVDAVLMALHSSGHLRAVRNGRDVAVGALDQTTVKRVEFRPEKVVLTAVQRIGLRGLFQKADVVARSGEEAQAAPAFVEKVRNLAAAAGGEPPLPPEPDTAFLDDLSRLAGAEQLAAICAQRESIGESTAQWKALAERRQRREPLWRRATDLRRHARSLSGTESLEQEFRAIERQRSLLEDTDRLAPLAGQLAGALRDAVTERRSELAAAVASAEEELAADATWQRLDPSEQDRILHRCRIKPPVENPIASPDELLSSLDARPLFAWRAEIDAVRERAARALAEAAKQLAAGAEAGLARAPTSVTIRRGTLANEAAVREWLREQEEKLLETVRKGPVVLR